MNSYLNAMQRYFDFGGRSSRPQFWYYTLVIIILSIVGLIIDGASGTGPVGEPGPVAGLIALVHLIPGLSVTVRRLHDINKSGWWVLIGLIPLVGLIVLLVFACTASTADNRFGPGVADAVPAPDASSGSQLPVSGDYLDQLEKLANLKAAGHIDDAEFQSMKADLVARSKG